MNNDISSPSPGPLSPAEWARRVHPETKFSAGALAAMRDYAAHVARLENRDVWHRAAEIVVEYNDNSLSFLVDDIRRDIMNIPFPARPDGEKQEPPC